MDLLASAWCSSVLMAKLFVVELLVKEQNVLQLGAEHLWDSC